MYIDVIRHGATSSTQGHRFNDHEHEPLADEALTSLARVDFDASKYERVDVSSLRRAVQTAEGLGLARFTLDVPRAIDFHEGDKIDEKALKALIKAAVALNSLKEGAARAARHARARKRSKSA